MPSQIKVDKINWTIAAQTTPDDHNVYAIECDASLIDDDWFELKDPKVELKALPAGLRYAFLGNNLTYLVIVSTALSKSELDMLLSELKNF